MVGNNILYLNLVAKIKRKFKGCVYDEYQGWKLKSDSINYIASLKTPDLIDSLKEMLDNYDGLEYKPIDIPYFSAVYIECFHQYRIFILSAKEQFNTLDPLVLNYGIDSKISDALKEQADRFNIEVLRDSDFFQTIMIITAFDLDILNSHGISGDDYYYTRMVNTQKEFVRLYQLYRKDPIHAENAMVKDYEHMRNFSKIYCSEIFAMRDVWNIDKTSDGLTVHDAGTSTSQLLMMLATLPTEELMGLKIKSCIASDLELNHNEMTLRYLREHPASKPVKFIKMDFTDESTELPQSDVTVINDVLEHFENDAVSFRVLERFWAKTGKLLLVHVPKETIPNPAWGHHVCFDKSKLLAWAGKLENAEVISDKYQFNEFVSLLDMGYLFVKKADKCV